MGAGLRGATREMTGYWWLWLVSGIAWLVISLVILQFDAASVTTVGVLVGFMFAFAGVQSLMLTTPDVAGSLPNGTYTRFGRSRKSSCSDTSCRLARPERRARGRAPRRARPRRRRPRALAAGS
jgi:hypothetical protein